MSNAIVNGMSGRTAVQADTTVLRAAFDAAGSPRWVMDAIKRHQLDTKHGLRLELDFVGDRASRKIYSAEAALAANQVDLIETDWISVARCRARGLAVSAVFPYGAILGGLVAACDSGIEDLSALRGRRIGVVRLLDKNWAVLRAVCIGERGFDPEAEAVVKEAGSSTALLELLRSGKVEAAVPYWHVIPRLVATGRFHQVCDLLELLPGLGHAVVPTAFFTCRDELIARRPETIRGFIAAFSEAVALMRLNRGIWRQIVGEILQENDSDCLEALRQKWQTRMCATWNGGVIAALDRLLGQIKHRCGSRAVGIEQMPVETFSYAFMS